MNNQLEMELDIENKFYEYHKENPQIYAEFKKITLNLIGRGFKHYSAKGVFEIVRWSTGVSANDNIFKINNNYTPLYARLFEKEFPNMKDFFRKRDSKFDR